MTRYQKVSRDETLVDLCRRINPENRAGVGLQLDGICRGVVCIPLPEPSPHFNCRYHGLLQRPNGDFLLFEGVEFSNEASIAKASSETGMPVIMQAYFNGKPLSVQGLRLGNIRSENYEG